MRNFFTSMFGALTALVIFFGGGFLLLFAVIIAIGAAASSEKPVAFEGGSYLVFDASANITDAPPPFDKEVLARILGGDQDTQTLQLRQITKSLRAAANDGRIAGVFISGNIQPVAYGAGYAALKEVRDALLAVKAAGKPVVAYLTYASTRDMYLASAASEIVLDPYGLIFMPGLATEPMFLAGAFEKFGIGVQVTRVGKYKSAIEPFTRQDMSPENRQQTQKLLDDVWSSILLDVANERGLTPAQLQSLVDAEGVIRADVALQSKLVTRVAYRDEIYKELRERTGKKESKEPFKQVDLVQYSKIAKDEPARVEGERKARSSGRIAVVYAEGAIVDGDGQADEVGGEKFSRELRKLRLDDDVKAIVLRVNSPGGSATASEHIQREVRLAREVKPVIVSMGSYAASGGYWISAYADRIFAEPSTITGSIGVFGVLLDLQKLTGNLGLTFDRVKTGKFADLMTVSRPKSPEEMAIYQRLVDWIYGEFISKVAEARKLDRAKVEEIAQGRVWSGAEALSLGLVDELGGLDAAIAFAAQKAGLGSSYRILEYPRRMEFAEMIAEALEGVKPATGRQGAVGQLTKQLEAEARVLEQFNDAAGVYARLPFELKLR
jgi:protease IV